MTALWGGVLAALALIAGYAAYGWPGLALGATVVVFWLLLQFSQALRLMRQAGARPMGSVTSAVMLHARMRTGLRLAEVMKLTGSFGRNTTDASSSPAPADTEVFVWSDAGGDRLEVTLVAGKVSRWRLERAAVDSNGAPVAQADA